MVEAMPNRSWWVSPWQSRGMGSSLLTGAVLAAACAVILAAARRRGHLIPRGGQNLLIEQ
jgi:hypothetical protein